GKTEDADKLTAEAKLYRKAIDETLKKTGTTYFPPSWEKAGTFWGNTETLWPTELFERNDPRVTATIQYARKKLGTGFCEGTIRWLGTDDAIHPYMSAYTTMASLVRGEDEAVVEDFYWYLLHSTATHAFPEGIFFKKREAWSNTIPHVTGACNYAIMLRHMLIHERGDELHLLSAVPDWWLENGQMIRVDRAPTYFGPMSLTIRGLNDGVNVQIQLPNRTPPKRVVLHLPENRKLVGKVQGMKVKYRPVQKKRWDFPAVTKLYQNQIDTAALRLVPFPKEISLKADSCALDRPMVLAAPAGVIDVIGRLLTAELRRASLPAPTLRTLGKNVHWMSLSTRADISPAKFQFRDDVTPEDYAIDIKSDTIVCGSPGPQGLFYAAQTLCQLIRANRCGNGVPCLSIRDWPSLRWRCFQNDMTRGPSAKLDTLKGQADIGSYLKMNLFSYYMEHQFAFKKHPVIGPEDGSLTPEDLKVLIEYARPLQMDVLGNQQSFGHFGNILKHPEFAGLRETDGILCPVKEESYKLLDDMYSEVCPLLPLPMFNVCCDETFGLGEGPSKELAQQIGVGGVYVRHICRIHDILKKNYNKRMMMWGDIILQHPDKLDQIPKDTIMLTWGYGAAASFEHQILPFTKSGYEFLVCPGVSSWSRILPDFRCATINVRNFVRDGAKHGAIGMLNTDWKDDSESLNAPTWHGFAWGAECSWNASATTPDDFNRRLGAVLFGEKEDHFGQAINLLSRTHNMNGMKGMNNRRFWENDFMPQREFETIRNSAAQLLNVVRPAIDHLEACKKDATVNAELLDAFIFGARRMELIGQRMLDGMEAVVAYNHAYDGPLDQAVPVLKKIEALVRKNRNVHEMLGKQFAAMWDKEVKPYALDRTMSKYADLAKWHDNLLLRLGDAQKKAGSGQSIPRPEEIGLGLPDTFARRSWPHERANHPLTPEAPWADKSASHRLGLIVRAGNVDRYELPVELELSLPD
ncbi:MAG: glycoside hydrolase family 20 zincin-like fold domain-containing protein, partial [Kiritimatiellae bacterium]|nr:glycoside hydrolase family 20 zincin-like fold domain-containing protein [Kiritimatiellia bacterium]